MATPPRYFQKGSYYHVYNRGTRKQKIFLQDKDYIRFLDRLKEYKDEFQITILSYCLMPNHYHLLLKQETEKPVTFFMLKLGTSYAKYFNVKYDEVGSIFQGRFKAKLIESDEYLLHLSRYIHRNPMTTPGVELGYFPWSSYPLYLRGEQNDLADPTFILDYFAINNQTVDYKQFTEYEFKEDDVGQIKDYIFEE